VEAEASRRGIAVHVVREGDDLVELAREEEAEALGVAGGDGSLAAVASVAIERELPFVCVPYGTRNHFARDLGLDRNDPLAALDAFSGDERRIDVGRVGDQLFLNNVSLGLYAGLVHRREHHRRRRDVLARVRALALSLRHRHRTRFAIDGSTVAARVVLVANNAYALDVFNLGARERLDEGLLHLYVPEGLVPGRWHDRSAETFNIDAPGHRTRAAIDGEPVTLETPLEFRVERGALRVLVPRAPG
jgi:diacylglycerol kinase family enzyme